MPDSSRNFSQGTIRKIAIVHQAHFQAGGAATYESNLSDLARNITADSNFDLLELFPAGNGIPKQKRSQTGVSAKTHLYSKGFFQLVQILLHSFPMSRKFLKLLGFGSTQFELQLNKLGVNLHGNKYKSKPISYNQTNKNAFIFGDVMQRAKRYT